LKMDYRTKVAGWQDLPRREDSEAIFAADVSQATSELEN
jgi:hypothetical protein